MPGQSSACREGSEDGVALLAVMLLMFLFSAIAFGVASLARIETLVARGFEHAAGGLYAAEAGLAVAISELRTHAEWTPVLAGAPSPASDGNFLGSRVVAGGQTVVLCCGPDSEAARIGLENRLSPLPARRALRFQPFLWTTVDGLVRPASPSGWFVVVFVEDDEGDPDGDGAADANGVIVVRSVAIGPAGARRAVEALVGRRPAGPGGGALGVLRWREVR